MPETPECPCGSGRPYRDCCRRYHQGEAAPTPEALMRSRYSAFVLKLTNYLLTTWHPDTRPASLPLDDSPDWKSLQVLSSGEQGDSGQVHFRAVYRLPGGFGYLEEASDFVREDGRWLYVSGETREGRLEPGRNDRCPCGSGRKFKACCLKR
ncbi:YchJ family protein [Marinobacter sp. AN1]|uniref:YchJ family protein n=1 Tax=Marinobacter sp. AN1 TaxID=2886046 RepID=UPI002232AA19|nr:YchJ family protein [Marinobacter sp. AN1]UZD66144.1 YchJ family protein [Marinobacter sp. AN1]